MPRTIPDRLDPLVWKRERWSIAAVASTQPHRAPGRMQPKAPPGGGDRARPWCPVALAHQCAGAPDHRSGGL